MSGHKGVLLCCLCVLCGESSEEVCVHPTRGEARRISLDDVRRAQEDVKGQFRFAAERAAAFSAGRPFDSGLPACSTRRMLTVRTKLPRELVGKTIAFAPAGRMPKADLRVVTSGARIQEVEADAVAHRALVERLKVRCAPTLVRIRSEAELELVEDP